MTSVVRAFGGRRRDDVDPSRIPPGRCYERGFPVRSAGPTDTRRKDVSVDTLLDGVETAADWMTAFADGDYTTNMGLKTVTDGRAWIAYEYGGQPLEAEHRGPARLFVSHLYAWKSAKWVRGSGSRPRTSPASATAPAWSRSITTNQTTRSTHT